MHEKRAQYVYVQMVLSNWNGEQKSVEKRPHLLKHHIAYERIRKKME